MDTWMPWQRLVLMECFQVNGNGFLLQLTTIYSTVFNVLFLFLA